MSSLCEEDPNFKPTRLACYIRFFGMAAAGWLLAVFAINGQLRLPDKWFDISGWWWIPFLIVAPIAVLVVGVCIILAIGELGKWEGPTTGFISADINRLARKTPFPNVCRRILEALGILLFLPWILILFSAQSD